MMNFVLRHRLKDSNVLASTASEGPGKTKSESQVPLSSEARTGRPVGGEQFTQFFIDDDEKDSDSLKRKREAEDGERKRETEDGERKREAEDGERRRETEDGERDEKGRRTKLKNGVLLSSLNVQHTGTERPVMVVSL